MAKKRRIKLKKEFVYLGIVFLMAFFAFFSYKAILSFNFFETGNKEEFDKKDNNDNIVLQITSEKYYKKANHDRYIEYFNKNKKISFQDVVEDVNCNLDYEYYSIDNKADLNKGFLILVNKYYKLNSDYVPEQLVKTGKPYGDGRYINKDVYEAFIEMYNDISKESMNIFIASPYRSYSYQETLYSNYVEKNGKDEADTFSARAGYSEHQTGLAMDISNVKTAYTNFENTEEYKWMLENAHKYGFILRYPKGKEKQTGYIFEAWHYRYVGVEVAKYIYENDITFDEYYEYFLN